MGGTALLLGALDQVSLAYQTVPFWLLVTGHSLSVVTLYRGYTPFWLVSWLVGFLGAFGGGMSSALLLQSPATAAVGVFARNEIGLYYTLAWWAVNYCPGGWGVRVAELPPVRAASKLLRSILRANTVVQRVNAAVKLHPGVVAAPLVQGTLSACGGRLLVDAFGHCAGYKQGPNELSHPGYAMRSALVGTLCQYLLVHVGRVLTSQQGLGLVISIYVAHSLATDLTGQPCDYTAALGSLFHKVTLIPVPRVATAASPAAVAATPAAESGKTPRVSRRRAAAAVATSLSSGGELPQVEKEQVASASTAATRRTTQRRAAAVAKAG